MTNQEMAALVICALFVITLIANISNKFTLWRRARAMKRKTGSQLANKGIDQ